MADDCSVCPLFERTCVAPCKLPVYFHGGNMSSLLAISRKISFANVRKTLNALSAAKAYAWIAENLPSSDVAEDVSKLSDVKSTYSHGLQCSTFCVEVEVIQVMKVHWFSLCGQCGNQGPDYDCSICDFNKWEERFAMKALVSDTSGDLCVSIFNGLAEAMLGTSASVLNKFYLRDDGRYNDVMERIVGRRFKLTVRVTSLLLESDVPQPSVEVLRFEVMDDQSVESHFGAPIGVDGSMLTSLLPTLYIREEYMNILNEIEQLKDQVLGLGDSKKLEDLKEKFAAAEKGVRDALAQVEVQKYIFDSHMEQLHVREKKSRRYVHQLRMVLARFDVVSVEFDKAFKKVKDVIGAV